MYSCIAYTYTYAHTQLSLEMLSSLTVGGCPLTLITMVMWRMRGVRRPYFEPPDAVKRRPLGCLNFYYCMRPAKDVIIYRYSESD